MSVSQSVAQEDFVHKKKHLIRRSCRPLPQKAPGASLLHRHRTLLQESTTWEDEGDGDPDWDGNEDDSEEDEHDHAAIKEDPIEKAKQPRIYCGNRRICLNGKCKCSTTNDPADTKCVKARIADRLRDGQGGSRKFGWGYGDEEVSAPAGEATPYRTGQRCVASSYQSRVKQSCCRPAWPSREIPHPTPPSPHIATSAQQGPPQVVPRQGLLPPPLRRPRGARPRQHGKFRIVRSGREVRSRERVRVFALAGGRGEGNSGGGRGGRGVHLQREWGAPALLLLLQGPALRS